MTFQVNDPGIEDSEVSSSRKFGDFSKLNRCMCDCTSQFLIIVYNYNI